QSDGDAGTPGAVSHFGVGAESRRAEVLLHQLGSDLYLLLPAFRNAAGLLAADGADLALQAADAGLARVAADDETDGGVGEVDVGFGVEAVLRRLARHQVAEGD